MAGSGAVYTLVNTNEAELETEKFIKKHSLYEPANQAIIKIKTHLFNNIYDHLKYNIELWVESAMNLTAYEKYRRL